MRIYQPCPIELGATIELDERGSHYLIRVLRVQMNEQVSLFNGLGGEFTCTVVAVGKKRIKLKVLTAVAREVESPIHLTLAQGLARGEKMDYIVQKAVELGVVTVIPLITTRSTVKLTRERAEKKVNHWQQIAISACEQSGRNVIPQIEPITDYDDWIKHAQADYKWVLDPHAKATLRVNDQKKSNMILLIGPEGGLTTDEVRMAEQNGFKTLTLGPRILRTETAPIAALAILQALFGDLLH